MASFFVLIAVLVLLMGGAGPGPTIAVHVVPAIAPNQIQGAVHVVPAIAPNQIQAAAGPGPGPDDDAIANVHAFPAIPNMIQAVAGPGPGPGPGPDDANTGDDDDDDNTVGEEVNSDDDANTGDDDDNTVGEEVNSDDDDEAGPGPSGTKKEDEICRWKSMGFVLCLLCVSSSQKEEKLIKFHKKSVMQKHIHYRHKGKNAMTKNDFECSKCGQPVKVGHKCTVPNGYQAN